MEDEASVVCAICGYSGRDITKHLKDHCITTAEYKIKYNAKVICTDVEKKRKETCRDKYGDENYKNKDAATLSNEFFEGGHSLRDPSVKEKIRETKEALYGDPTFTNREKAKQTCLEKYGVEYTCQVPEIINKRVATLKERYGKVFNVDGPCNKKDPPESFKSDYIQNIRITELCKKYKISEPTVSRWVKELHLSKRVIPSIERNNQSPGEIVAEFLSYCLDTKKLLSFYDYGKLRGSSYCNKVKRLFNAGKPYHHLLDELKSVALSPERWPEFLDKFKSSVPEE